jgi:hypothetical protein
MTGTTDDKDKFVPAFAMPVIAPPPDGYAADAAAYYLELASQTTVTPALVEVLPEQLLPPMNPLEKKGMLVTITNPNAIFQPSVPLTGSGDPNSTLPPLPTFDTLFALMGGNLIYRRATAPDGLNSLLPSQFDGITPAVQYPSPAGLLTAAWGTLVLTLWGTDFDKLQTALNDNPACLTIYYVGVDEASLAPLLKPALKQMFTEQVYLDFLAAQNLLELAAQKKPVIREVDEAVRLIPYTTAPAATTPTYDQLINDLLAQFVNGTTSLMVKGGMPIGRAIQCDPSGMVGSQTIAQVELWFIDAGALQQFISPVWIITEALIYDF